MNSDTPIYDELADKWEETTNFKAIGDMYWTVTNNATGQSWFEDDEGNEVFPEPALNIPALEASLSKEAKAIKEILNREPIKKRKFKLLGRNQHCQGTL